MSTTIASKEVTRSASYVSPCFPMEGHRFHGADGKEKYEYNYCLERSHNLDRHHLLARVFQWKVIVLMELIVKRNMSTTIASKEVTRSASSVSPCFPMEGHRSHGADSQGKYEYNYCLERSHKIGIIC